MDDELARRGGIPPVDASALEHPEAADFKEQVQLAYMLRTQETGTSFAISRIELRGDAKRDQGTVVAVVFGVMGHSEPVYRVSGRTPKELADALYQRMGGTITAGR
jgi:hypothetical protein